MTKLDCQKQVTMVAFADSEIAEMWNALNELKASIAKMQEESYLSKWIESESARKMLGVCSKTWQTMRDRRTIPFSQFGRKIYVKVSDIEAFMESNLIKK